ncbi:MAG TPA: glycosyltransferase [Verrucomicrobiae bacterium]|nr:glycosyltransferase [Verrucomicrobiae bacterium]
MTKQPRIIFLSNIYDQHYHDVRGEKIEPCLTIACRRDMFRCLNAAASRELVVLSSPPKALERRSGKWLPAVETQFAGFRQLFCPIWDVPKLRIPLAWFYYARHVLHHVRDGDVVVIDNYEFLYIVAARLLRRFRRVKFVLAYLDGKHLIDRSVWRVLSGLAEKWGRPLLNGAVLSTPPLGEHLPVALPKVVLPGPGFILRNPDTAPRQPEGEVRFLYAGSLDATRGVDLLLTALALLPESGWHLDLAGAGALKDQVVQAAQDQRWREMVTFHPSMASTSAAYQQLLASAHVGLNCQRKSDPISAVTFPTKVFAYLSAGLLVISSQASSVATVCGKGCFYYVEETPESLAAAMREVIQHYAAIRDRLDVSEACQRYSIEASADRVRQMFQRMGVVK